MCLDNHTLADAYFANDKLPLAYDLTLSSALINMTAQAMAATPAAAGLPLYGLSASMFDVAQCGNGGTEYLSYERAVLNAPGVMRTIQAATFHPYAPGVWVPWQVGGYTLPIVGLPMLRVSGSPSM